MSFPNEGAATPANLHMRYAWEDGREVSSPAAKVIAERDEEIRQLKAHANELADRLRDWDRWWQIASGTLARSGMVCKRTEIALLAHDAIVNKPRRK